MVPYFQLYGELFLEYPQESPGKLVEDSLSQLFLKTRHTVHKKVTENPGRIGYGTVLPELNPGYLINKSLNHRRFLS